MRSILGRAGIVSLLVTSLALAPSPARGGVLPPRGAPYGASYSEWAAAWWQWALSAPVETNPVLDSNGEHCAVGQSGHVWFLAGTFGSGTAVRSCTVPTGRAILVPILNQAYFAFTDDPPEQRTEAFVRSQVTAIEGSSGLFLEVDEKLVRRVDRFLEKSALFSVELPADNVFGLPAGFVLDPCADEGFYVMLTPLPAGEHTIHFGGTNSSLSLMVDVTYHLTVRPKH